MGTFNDVGGWVLVVIAIIAASAPVARLVHARRSRARLRGTAESVWAPLLLSLAWLIDGVYCILHEDASWVRLTCPPLGIAALACLIIPGAVARRRNGLPWWRLWERAVPALSGADLTGLAAPRRSPRPPGAPSAIVLDATARGLIDRITNATFDTTRFSAGYDEEEVDVFLDQLIAVLGAAGRPDQEELATVRFSTTWLRPGYAMQDVNALLQEVSHATRA